MLRLENHAHAAGTQEIEDPVVAHEQLGEVPHADAGGLVIGEEMDFHEPGEQFSGCGQRLQLLKERSRERLPVVRANNAGLAHLRKQLTPRKAERRRSACKAR